GAHVHHAHVAPEDAAADAGAQRLGAGLLGREPLGVAGRGIELALGARPLDLGEHPMGEPIAEAVQALLHPADVGEVRAQADDHAAFPARASSIRARIRRMAGPSPMKIASPIRKWPMLSSTSSGMAAIAQTVS